RSFARLMRMHAWCRSIPSAHATCPAFTPSSPPPTCRRSPSSRTASPPPRALIATCNRPSRATSSVTWASRWRWSSPTIRTALALETRGLVALPPDPRGGELHLIGSTKCIHINRTILAPIFGIPLGALRLTEVDVGGGFGVRGELYPEDILVPLGAMKLGRA